MRTETILVALPVLALAALGPVAGAGAQALEDRNARVAIDLALGFGGDLDVYANSMQTDLDLQPSIGFDLRGEVPVADFLAVGGLFRFMSFDAKDLTFVRFEREETFSFDAYVRGRWVFQLGEAFFEPYAILPVGFTGALLDDPDGPGDEVYPGWNLGVLAGIAVFHALGIGGYLELGWHHYEVYTEFGPSSMRTRLSFVANEFALNLGAIYRIPGS